MSERRFGSLDDGDDDLNVDISPMIDCVFILLIFFIVTTVFIEESGFRVNMPEATQVSATSSDSFSIQVTAEDKILINGKAAGMGDVASAVKARLAQKKNSPVSIEGAQNSRVGTVQRVHDVARSAIQSVGGDVNLITISTSN